MGQNFPEFLKLGIVAMIALANTTLTTGLDLAQVETYGVGGISVGVAALFYQLWRKQSLARDAEHKATVEALKAEILRLREKYND